MAEIKKNQGTTPSERYLARLADKTFLNLWAYPNVYRSPGKELCDLLVVCGNNVIIFSDKQIPWKKDIDTDLAWKRWYRHAVAESVDQLRGAERWITKHPDKVFLDAACQQPFPIQIPTPSHRKIYLIAVALGASEACSRYFHGDSGSFMIRPDLLADEHHNSDSPLYAPFTIGDVHPSGNFIHVMNDATLDLTMEELDTVKDFTDYLERKAHFIRSGNLIYTTGEEELLAYYLTHTNDEGKHDFVHPKNPAWSPSDKVGLDQGFYTGMRTNPEYIRKKAADQNSYLWDGLIENFTTKMLSGDMFSPNKPTVDLSIQESVVRYMALEPRLTRRVYGERILQVLKKSNTQDRVFTCMLPPPDTVDNVGIAYCFMTFAHPKFQEGTITYEQYRHIRQQTLGLYCFGILRKYPNLRQIIGIATEPIPVPGGPIGSSEDLICIQQQVWTEKQLADLEHDLQALGILREDKMEFKQQMVTEYPDAQN